MCFRLHSKTPNLRVFFDKRHPTKTTHAVAETLGITRHVAPSSQVQPVGRRLCGVLFPVCLVKHTFPAACCYRLAVSTLGLHLVHIWDYLNAPYMYGHTVILSKVSSNRASRDAPALSCYRMNGVKDTNLTARTPPAPCLISHPLPLGLVVADRSLSFSLSIPFHPSPRPLLASRRYRVE